MNCLRGIGPPTSFGGSRVLMIAFATHKMTVFIAALIRTPLWKPMGPWNKWLSIIGCRTAPVSSTVSWWFIWGQLVRKANLAQCQPLQPPSPKVDCAESSATRLLNLSMANISIMFCVDERGIATWYVNNPCTQPTAEGMTEKDLEIY